MTNTQDYKELIKQEYIKCASDPAYFMRRYVMIQHPQRGRILFNLYPFQADVLHLFRDSENIIVLKSRQLGISTLAAGYSLWLLLFSRDKNILCLATTQATARNLVSKVIFAYEQLPRWLQVPAVQKNKLSLRLSNGSKIEAKSSSPDAARSESVSLLLIDEAAFIDNIRETFTAAQPTLSTGGQVMILSTPNGTSGFFYETWCKAELGENTFVPVKLPWQVHPERDQAWRDKQDADLGPKAASQECVSGDTLVTLKNRITGEEFGCTIEEAYNNTVTGQESTHLIKTPGGYKPFYGVRKVHKDFYYELKLSDRTTLKASNNHKVLTLSGELKEVEKLRLKDYVCLSSGSSKVKCLQKVDEPIDLYDAVEVGEDHLYITNGIVSKNCDANFLTSGDTFFDLDDIAFYEETYCIDPVERRGKDANYWIWEYPDYTKSYLISADVARGDGSDYSAFHVWDVETCTQVAEYKGQVTPKDFGAILTGVATEYNNALLVCENANVGWATIEEIMSRNYGNLYYSDNSNNITDTAENYARKSETGRLTPGFTTSLKTRPLLLAKLYDFIHQRQVIIRSKRLLLEARNFVWLSGKSQAAPGSHDDLVMSAGIGIFVRDTALRLRQQGLDLSRAQMSSFGNLNRRDVGPIVTSYAPNPYQIQDPHGHMEDISWVL